MADPGVYLEKLSAFSRMLRLDGLAVSPKETEDAAKLLINLGMQDREQVKTALRTVYAKSREEQLQFDRIFDGFFISEEAMKKQAKEQMQREQEMAAAQAQAEQDLQISGQPMDLSPEQRAAYAAMPEEARQRLRNFMDKYRGNAERNPRLYGEFIHSVFARAILEQQMLMEDAVVGAAEADPELGLLYRDISQFKDAEIPQGHRSDPDRCPADQRRIVRQAEKQRPLRQAGLPAHHPQGTGNRRQLLPSEIQA